MILKLYLISFLHIDFLSILLDLYLSFSFLRGVNVNDIEFLISKSTFELLVYRKVNDFVN